MKMIFTIIILLLTITPTFQYKNCGKISILFLVYIFQLFVYNLAEVPNFMMYQSKIVGGKSASAPIPWQVSIRWQNSHYCGGTIIDSTTILSAAHCFYGHSLDGDSILAGYIWTNHLSGGQVWIS